LDIINACRQALNFFVLGGFSPLRIRSAPKAFPLAGHPYLGPNALFQTLQELPDSMISEQVTAIRVYLSVDIRV
jgi:hypothetical protein